MSLIQTAVSDAVEVLGLFTLTVYVSVSPGLTGVVSGTDEVFVMPRPTALVWYVLNTKSRVLNSWITPPTERVPRACTWFRVSAPLAKAAVVCARNVIRIVWLGSMLPRTPWSQVRVGPGEPAGSSFLVVRSGSVIVVDPGL